MQNLNIEGFENGNIAGYSRSDFMNLSEQEKYDAVKDYLSNLASQGNVRMSMYNKETGEQFNVADILNTDKEEQFIKMLVKMFMDEDTNVQAVAVSKEEIEEIIRKVTNNEELTPLEQAKAKTFMGMIDQEKSGEVVRNTSALLANIIKFSQEKLGYTGSIGDYIQAVYATFMVQAFSDKTCILSNYRNNPDMGDKIIREVADDIMDTWTKTCTNIPDKMTVLMALLAAAVDIAVDLTVAPVDVFSIIFNELEEAGDPIKVDLSRPENDDGSNNSNVQTANTFTDEDMRSLLQD